MWYMRFPCHSGNWPRCNGFFFFCQKVKPFKNHVFGIVSYVWCYFVCYYHKLWYSFVHKIKWVLFCFLVFLVWLYGSQTPSHTLSTCLKSYFFFGSTTLKNIYAQVIILSSTNRVHKLEFPYNILNPSQSIRPKTKEPPVRMLKVAMVTFTFIFHNTSLSIWLF